jgi:hypothetical protein
VGVVVGWKACGDDDAVPVAAVAAPVVVAPHVAAQAPYCWFESLRSTNPNAAAAPEWMKEDAMHDVIS